MENKLTEREENVRKVSINYIKAHTLLSDAREGYEQKRSWGILEHLLEEEKRKIKIFEEQCVSLDISLGYLVVEGDKEKIPEYAKALKLN